ncbi:MAG: hypothetical protein FWD22_07350 [Treponema sp.]|nr:hypothetical protein [Treponema sp.]
MKNISIIKTLFSLMMILLLPSLALAADFGLITNVSGGYNNFDAEENKFNFKTDFWPRFSALIGDNAEVLVTAGFTLGMEEEFYTVPELLNTEFLINIGASQIRAGRFNYSDPLAFIADGLFDGVQITYASDSGYFKMGVWYTGFLYKKQAHITMTLTDFLDFSVPFTYDDFLNTYFAPKRLLASFGWEHPSVFETINIKTALIGQTDLNNRDLKYHNQYLVLKADLPIDNFQIDLGGSIEFSQTVASESSFGIAFAGDFGFSWIVPADFNSRFAFTAKIAGGKVDDTVTAFVPITSKEYGYILKHKMSGLSVFGLDYSASFNNPISVSITGLYFVRNDLGTFSGYPLDEQAIADNKGYFLGPEISARLVWSPASDLHLSLGGGVFVPSLGDAGSDERMKWRMELSAAMVLY